MTPEAEESIQTTLARGDKVLDEHRSKLFLARYGVPVVREAIVHNIEEAIPAAARIGFPVVLKAVGAGLFHKTEVGGVALNLRCKEDLLAEGNRLLEIPGCEALLVQEMVLGSRELVCGMSREDAFGPCVMFGLGGILTELVNDVVFRVAPLTIDDATDMLEEIRGKGITGPFRGESSADRRSIAHILVTLGELGLSRKEIHDIDVNPLVLRRSGAPVVADALIVLREGE